MIINSIIAGAGTSGNIIHHESGTVAYHTGSTNLTIKIPCTDMSLDNYFVKAKAIKSWKKVDGVWVEQDSLDYTGLTTVATWLCIAFACFEPQLTNTSYKINDGTTGTVQNLHGDALRVNAYASGNATAQGVSSISKASDGLSITMTSNFNICVSQIGQTFQYDIWGWNN